MEDIQNKNMDVHESPVIPRTFDDSKVIQFQCSKGISCWNKCCSNIDISLTPYDILRLKNRFDMVSGLFLQKYTVPYEIEKGSIAGVKLRPVENGTACQFMTPEGCSVYEDRPTSCRYYPIALLSMRKQDEYVDSNAYALVKEEHCLGHNEPREITVADYRKEQGLQEYDDLARGWRQLILKKQSSGPSIGKPSKRSLELFFMVCYDIDRFSSFVASDGFNAMYDIEAEEMKKILSDDTELMLFGFRFLKQILFGENTITQRVEGVEKRKESYQEKAKRLELEAAQRRAAEQDDAYSDHDKECP